MKERLSHINQVPKDCQPGYRPKDHGVGIVHLGLGSFFKAHLAAFTDELIAKQGGDWRILGVSLRSQKAMEEVAPQNGLYTLITKSAGGSHCRVIGALADAMCSANDSESVLAAMIAHTTKIVSLTVTEKAYGFDRATMGCDSKHPAVAIDLLNPNEPKGVLGLITQALKRRKESKVPAFTVLCCDNLPDNGRLLRGAVVDFAQRLDKDLAQWIVENVAFPSTMVDRITPAPNEDTYREAVRFIGVQDLATVETEEFNQWVIEDDFPQGRPNWDIAGAIFTEDVPSFEKMKLRMLNGSHSMLAYVGFHAGYKYVRDVMADKALANLVKRHLDAASKTLLPIEGVDYSKYADSLIERFRNPAIAHETFQIAMDGSEKMPQRILSAVSDARATSIDIRPFAFATAAWIRHISASTHDCAIYEIRDPKADELKELTKGKHSIDIIPALRLARFIPSNVQADEGFWGVVESLLNHMLTKPMADVIAQEALWCHDVPTGVFKA